ncbi:uncharacterized protein PGTG_02791 [Puccinia graminis f. sp. tritici CRL 75-36-700-3]|uniref:Uncharacterized protein n=1 Tax=Puccinia graminis f. sp. tritici (strain CRL 75-36-700-3 / race SCCL) TaxID=418459 RepID=E3JWC5_PUCGT|nr:uncharacterized protein PGTG_02791 [Puccinia graminis f. sp. tritici CRL 75-36-700-3]EFP76350.2 hypothetical protein PGTG_02791 [Puccinia graminis f. sp. tritici CRL 75-36-700-3]
MSIFIFGSRESAFDSTNTQKMKAFWMVFGLVALLHLHHLSATHDPNMMLSDIASYPTGAGSSFTENHSSGLNQQGSIPLSVPLTARNQHSKRLMLFDYMGVEGQRESSLSLRRAGRDTTEHTVYQPASKQQKLDLTLSLGLPGMGKDATVLPNSSSSSCLKSSPFEEEKDHS